MNGRKAKKLRRVAKGLFFELYAELLPSGTEFTVDQAIMYSPRLWKSVCRKVKRNPSVTLDDLRAK